MGHRYLCHARSVVLPLLLIIGLSLATAAAQGILEGTIVKIDKPVSVEALADAGMLMLADLGDAYLVLGTRVATGRLAAVTPGFRVIAPVSPGRDIYLLRPKSLKAEMLYSAALIEVAKGAYLAQMDSDEMADLGMLPFSRIRLTPQPFIRRETQMPAQTPTVITPKPEIESIVAQVSGDTLWNYIAELSGEKPVVIGGMLDTLLTRFTFSEKIDNAADYLLERFQEDGLDVELQEYVQGKYDFYDVDAIDEDYGWVVGYKRCYRTTDGGVTWIGRKPSGFNQIFLDVCFLDSLEGWVVGAPGLIYHTADGGALWTNQPSPGTMVWIYDVFFLDPLNGWVAGTNGEIGITTDGGATWTIQTTGTTETIYGLWFTSTNRGWACGGGGTLLYWDGVSWSPQTSGASDFLRDLCFADDNTGWAVGAGRAALKTTDGGITWTPLPIPVSPNLFLTDVCFIDSSEGWIAEFDGTILHTTDGGASWETQHAEGAPSLYGIDLMSASHGWSTGLGCAIQHTASGGTTWAQQTTNLPAGAWGTQENVIATKPGTVSGEQVIICGHYDCLSEVSASLAPGADDNASGTAAVLEAARLLAPESFERTIKFVCLTGEEQGLYGSAEYAGRALGAGDEIAAVLNLDMIGYVDAAPEDFDVISDSTSEWLADLVVDCATAYVPARTAMKDVDPGMLYGDHASFWRLGYDAVNCTEDTEVAYPYYHTTGDTLGHLDQSLATDILKIAVAAVAELAVPDPAGAIHGRPEITLATSAQPNPFKADTRLAFILSAAARVEVRVFDIEGRLVKTLLEAPLGAGPHGVVWDGTDAEGARVAPGVYFTGISTGSVSRHAKVVLLR
ncbi:M28 family peptidase [Candidatus Eisenbacteria bacterium]|uniref:M28 family peptidase n=1 Tax=Eiseniibacteriota bacterium TaxID=2212470 RepID=A0ABV6YMU8_UNCEI